MFAFASVIFRFSVGLYAGRMKVEVETFAPASEAKRARDGAPKPAQPTDGRHAEEVLRHFRETLAAERSLFPFAVLSDTQVARLAEAMPATMEQVQRCTVTYSNLFICAAVSLTVLPCTTVWGISVAPCTVVAEGLLNWKAFGTCAWRLSG